MREVTANVRKRVEISSGRYNSFSLSLLGLLSKAINEANPTSQKARAKLDKAINRAALDYLLSERETIKHYADEIYTLALENLTSDDEKHRAISDEKMAIWKDHVEAAAEDAFVNITAQIMRETRAVNNELRRFGLNVEMVRESKNWSLNASIIAIRESGAQRGAGYRADYVDRAGKKWRAGKYVKALYSSFLINLYNETYIFAASSLGYKSGYIDAGRGSLDGFEFSFIELVDEGVVTYGQLLSEGVIHPNSDLFVAIKNKS